MITNSLLLRIVLLCNGTFLSGAFFAPGTSRYSSASRIAVDSPTTVPKIINNDSASSSSTTWPSSTSSSLTMSTTNDDEEKFGMSQRIASTKALAVGAVVGGLALAVPEFVHQTILEPSLDLTVNGGGLAQFEFNNDMGSLSAGLFAIVYRYTIRLDESDQLKQGVVGAFTLTRALGRIVVPASCSSIPLYCGEPLGYLDWNMLEQIGINTVESGIMYATTAAAMDLCMDKGWIKKFPG